MSKKTIYIILGIIFGLAVIGWLVWYFVLSQETTIAPTGGVDFTVPRQAAKTSDLKVISEVPVLYLDKNNEVISFYDFSGRLWQFNETEEKPTLIDQAPNENLAEIIWPKVFSPDSKKIVYQKNSGLFTSDSGGKNQKTLASDLKIKDVILKWPSANNIAIVSKPSGAIAGNLWLFDVRNSNINKVIDSFFGLETLFSPDGSSFIYSYTDQNGKNPILGFYDKNGGKKIISNVSTLVDKCAWSTNNYIYCAVPKSWPDFAILPDDYYKNAFLTNDDIWKINVETGEKILIFEHIGNISNLAVSRDESRVFFISKENQFLYKLIIK